MNDVRRTVLRNGPKNGQDKGSWSKAEVCKVAFDINLPALFPDAEVSVHLTGQFYYPQHSY